MSASQHVHMGIIAGTRAGTFIDPLTSRLPHVTQGIDEWKTPFPLRKGERKGESNLIDRSKKTTKSLTPIGRVDPNGFAALLGTDVDEEDLAGVGSGKASVGDAPPSSTKPSARTALLVQRALLVTNPRLHCPGRRGGDRADLDALRFPLRQVLLVRDAVHLLLRGDWPGLLGHCSVCVRLWRRLRVPRVGVCARRGRNPGEAADLY